MKNQLLTFSIIIIIILLLFLDIDECNVGSHNCTSENWQICNNTEGSFECACEPGFNFNADNYCEGIPYWSVSTSALCACTLYTISRYMHAKMPHTEA